VRRDVSLAGVKLSPFVGAHDLAGIRDRGRPVEALAERVAHEGAWRCVVAAYARVNVSKGLAPVDIKSAPYAKHIASRISWLHTRGPGVRIWKRASQFSLKLTKDENG
jgi:hypothetical protein